VNRLLKANPTPSQDESNPSVKVKRGDHKLLKGDTGYMRYLKPDFWNLCLGGVQGKQSMQQMEEKMFVKYAKKKATGTI
jgi:hypothetical protein